MPVNQNLNHNMKKALLFFTMGLVNTTCVKVRTHPFRTLRSKKSLNLEDLLEDNLITSKEN